MGILRLEEEKRCTDQVEAGMKGSRIDLSRYKEQQALDSLGWELNHVMCAFGRFCRRHFSGKFNLKISSELYQIVMSTLSLRLPESIHRDAKIYAQRKGISVNQLAATALAEKLAALATEDYLAQRAKRATKARFKAALAKVPDARPMPGDELP